MKILIDLMKFLLHYMDWLQENADFRGEVKVSVKIFDMYRLLAQFLCSSLISLKFGRRIRKVIRKANEALDEPRMLYINDRLRSYA